eukprot:463222-Rhodomonas_salina.1
MSLPPDLLGRVFQQAQRVIDGVATCRHLERTLPQHAEGLTLAIKPPWDLRAIQYIGLTQSTVAHSLQRWAATPRLALVLCDESTTQHTNAIDRVHEEVKLPELPSIAVLRYQIAWYAEK